MTSANPHALHSQLRESITTHAFLAAIGAESWRRGHFNAEIMRAEFDTGAHDLVITANGITRQIQLKAKNSSGKTNSWSVSERLAAQPSGCVVLLHVYETNLHIVKYGLFADPPGCKLPDITMFSKTKHTKGDSTGLKAVKEGKWNVPIGKFNNYERVPELYDALFGPEPPHTG